MGTSCFSASTYKNSTRYNVKTGPAEIFPSGPVLIYSSIPLFINTLYFILWISFNLFFIVSDAKPGHRQKCRGTGNCHDKNVHCNSPFLSSFHSLFTFFIYFLQIVNIILNCMISVKKYVPFHSGFLSRYFRFCEGHKNKKATCQCISCIRRSPFYFFFGHTVTTIKSRLHTQCQMLSAPFLYTFYLLRLL